MGKPKGGLVGDLSQQVGERISRLRAARGKTLAQMAAATGIPASQIMLAQ